MDVNEPHPVDAGAPARRPTRPGAGRAAAPSTGEWPYVRPRGRHEHSSARWYGRLTAMGGVVLLGVAVTAAGAIAGRRMAAAPPRWQAAAPATEPPTLRASGGRAAQAPSPDRVSLAATGDVILGSAPHRLPPRDGAGFFDDVRRALTADLVMGNLEQPLTDDTGVGKCGATPTAPAAAGRAAPGCYQFRAPPRYAAHLKAAGFHLLNQANNHAHDFGAAGLRHTRRALDRHGLRYTGSADEVTVVDVHGVRVAVVGFSVYSWSNNLLRFDEATALVRKAGAQADVVVVQAHMGAEGAGRTAVRPGEERFAGENRGDPMRFSRAVVDAGADLVVGHGPHVLRGMEFYKGRLIAYSLGNFAAGGGVLKESGPSGIGGVLRVTLRRDGSWGGGEFVSTAMSAGRPRLDAAGSGADLLRSLSRRDFPGTGAQVDHTARISPPDGS